MTTRVPFLHHNHLVQFSSWIKQPVWRDVPRGTINVPKNVQNVTFSSFYMNFLHILQEGVSRILWGPMLASMEAQEVGSAFYITAVVREARSEPVAHGRPRPHRVTLRAQPPGRMQRPCFSKCYRRYHRLRQPCWVNDALLSLYFQTYYQPIAYVKREFRGNVSPVSVFFPIFWELLTNVPWQCNDSF